MIQLEALAAETGFQLEALEKVCVWASCSKTSTIIPTLLTYEGAPDSFVNRYLKAEIAQLSIVKLANSGAISGDSRLELDYFIA